MGRPAGSKNYNHEKLIKIIADIKPKKCNLQWARVASDYKKATKEKEERDPAAPLLGKP